VITKGRDIVIRKDAPLNASMQFSNSFFLNLFGTIANLPASSFLSGMDFAPISNNGDILKLTGQDSAAWLGMKNRMMQKYAYDYCFPVASVVDQLGHYDTTCELEINYITLKRGGNTAKNTWANNMRRLLSQPNPLQDWHQFRGQQVMYKKIFGYCPVFVLKPSQMTPDYAAIMINLPPWLFDPVPRPGANILKATKLSDIVGGWRVNLPGGKMVILQPDDVFLLDDGYMQDELQHFILPKSRLVGLDMAISNLCAAMEADNVTLRKRGPLGFITHAPKTDPVSGNIAMTADEKNEIQTALQQYGLNWSQFQFAISRTPVRWESMGYNVTELGTKETIITAERAVCHRYAYPFILYEEQGSTYANVIQAEKNVYQNNVIPNNKKDFLKYEKYFLAEENNCCIYGNFSNVAILQEDEKNKGQAAQLWDQALQIRWLNNVITLNQWREQVGIDTTDDGDVYFKDMKTERPLTESQIQPTATNQ
jgi:hypothetical protein